MCGALSWHHVVWMVCVWCFVMAVLVWIVCVWCFVMAVVVWMMCVWGFVMTVVVWMMCVWGFVMAPRCLDGVCVVLCHGCFGLDQTNVVHDKAVLVWIQTKTAMCVWCSHGCCCLDDKALSWLLLFG